MFGVTILGNNSAIPAYDRHPTAQALYWHDQVFLIDCGEGTQMQLARYKVKRSQISHIFISHLHGDHYFGLIGLMNSMSLLGRKAPLHVYGPQGLQPIIQLQLESAGTVLNFPFVFHALEAETILLQDYRLRVTAFPVKHRIPCWGFLFQQLKPPRTLIKDRLLQYAIPQSFYNRLKMGEDYTTKTGETIANNLLTQEAPLGKSYGYCADTCYMPELADVVRGVTLLYHEATFTHDMAERAASRYHSTAREAAQLAGEAAVGRLLIGHFSSKYETLDAFATEAREVFPQTELALEGVTYLLR